MLTSSDLSRRDFCTTYFSFLSNYPKIKKNEKKSNTDKFSSSNLYFSSHKKKTEFFESHFDHTYFRKPVSAYKTARTSFENESCETVQADNRSNEKLCSKSTLGHIPGKTTVYAVFENLNLFRLIKNKKFVCFLLLFFLLLHIAYDVVFKTTLLMPFYNISSNAATLFFHAYNLMPNISWLVLGFRNFNSSSKSLSNKKDIKSIADEVIKKKIAYIEERVHSHYDLNSRKSDLHRMQIQILDLSLKYQSLIKSLKKLENYAIKTKNESQNHVEEFQKIYISPMHMKIKDFEGTLLALNSTMSNCSHQLITFHFNSTFENYFLTYFKKVLYNSSYFFNEWIHSKLLDNKKELYKELKIELEKFFEDITAAVHQNVEPVHANLTNEDIKLLNEYASVKTIQKLIKEAIMLYDADKTGKVDYALETGGGSIVSTRCSKSYIMNESKFSIFGFTLWSFYNPPRAAIQASVLPGNCWAFKGSKGNLVIRLSHTIYPTGFSLEHIPVSLSPSGSIDSAPKHFSVMGLFSKDDINGTLLGKYLYDANGYPLQYFPAKENLNKSFLYIELKIYSNHGNPKFTCLYRFRVHGHPKKQT